MNTYLIACTVFVTVCAGTCIWLFVKAKKEHDCAMWTLRATDDLMCRAVEILQRVDKDVDRLKIDVCELKSCNVDAQEITPEEHSPVGTDWNVKCHARHCAPRKTTPIDWEDEGE
jgi:hypothetical protein